MIFDFGRFAKIAASVYNEGNPYSLKECLGVFLYYFQTYEEYMGRPHPPIRREQIAYIMRNMPFVRQEDRGYGFATIVPVTYPNLINLHFKTRYRRCDHNINHFFSGRIREMRLHEYMAGYK